jgi:excinuclease ABC subunit C
MDTNSTKLELLKEQLKAVPLLPGVYLWKDVDGNVLYVGKAKQLRSRMRQYVNLQDERAMIPALMQKAVTFEYIVAASEHESLILEKNLIHQFSPAFNVDFKDDKSYPFIALTAGDVFPAIKYTREKPNPTTRYFGPYTDSRAARQIMDAARRIVPICRATCAEWKRLKRQIDAGGLEAITTKACFDAYVGLGPGPCAGDCTPEQYKDNVKKMERFLSGHRREFIDALEDEIAAAAADLDFERAGRAKTRLDTLLSLKDKQNVVLSPRLNADTIGFYREETITGVQVLSVRDGVVLLKNEFVLDKGLDVSDDELVSTFLLRYYEQATQIPKQIILRNIPQDATEIAIWLTDKLESKHGAKVNLQAPQRGERWELLKMAELNAKHTLLRYKVRTRYDEDRINRALLELESALALPNAPLRMECYDISTIHGKHSVASMVVFNGGKPDKSQYRRFKIKMETPEANDVAMMSEVISRRFSRKNLNDRKFAAKPDLLVVDGGKPQLNATLKQLALLGVTDVPVAGLAKRDEELFVTWQDSPVILPTGSVALYMIKQIRDESHRFAITFHREVRGKAMTISILDGISGLGPKRQKLLRRQFKSLKALKAASLQELAAVDGIPQEVASEVYTVLHQTSGIEE